MGTPHLEAKSGDIAEIVLLPGDPLRAKCIAEHFLDDLVCYNRVRNMLGFTGTYNGIPVSVQGTGMGVPSISIYLHELLSVYGVKTAIRVGSCGSFQEHIKVRDIVLAMSASTDSGTNKIRFRGMDFAPAADFGLLTRAYSAAQDIGIIPWVGNVLTADLFYHDDTEVWKLWASYGVLAAEMESSALYTLAAKFGAQALSVLTVSDNVVTGEQTSSMERQESFVEMVKIALEAAAGGAAFPDRTAAAGSL